MRTLTIMDIVTTVAPDSPEVTAWVERASRSVRRIVEEPFKGRIAKVEKVLPGRIIAGTGLRAQHMPDRRLCSAVTPGSPEWYATKARIAERSKSGTYDPDPFGVYTADGYTLMRDFYIRHLTRLGATAFIGGGATGADQLMMAAAQHMGLPTMLAVPMSTQASKWDREVQTIYTAQAKKADVVVLVSTDDELVINGEISQERVRAAMSRRNRFMVAHAHHVLATWKGTPGGTRNCIRDAAKMGVPVTEVYEQLTALIGYTRPDTREQPSLFDSTSFAETTARADAIDLVTEVERTMRALCTTSRFTMVPTETAITAHPSSLLHTSDLTVVRKNTGFDVDVAKANRPTAMMLPSAAWTGVSFSRPRRVGSFNPVPAVRMDARACTYSAAPGMVPLYALLANVMQFCNELHRGIEAEHSESNANYLRSIGRSALGHAAD